jgi:hypothetical protein
MNRGDISSVEGIQELSSSIDQHGYHSILFVYHSKMPDNLIKVVRSISDKQKIKYMIAIRTYAISPEYLSMICKSFNDMFGDRLMLNIVSGDIHDEETSVNDIVMFKEKLSTPDDRLIYTKEWMDKFISMFPGGKTPEIVMGGHSDFTREMSNQYDATHLSMLDMHIKHLNKDKHIINNKQMVSVSIVARETYDEAELFMSQAENKSSKQWTIYGSKKEIVDKINEIKSLGVTDIIISASPNDQKQIYIHDIIKEMMEA